MLFRKKIERACAYCIHATKLDDDQFLCAKNGMKNGADKCRRFKYDPTKRVPVKAKALDFSKYTAEDFSL